MRIKKYAAAFLAATTVLGSLAACGGNKDVDTTPAPTTPPTTTEEPSTGDKKDDDKEPAGPTATPIPARDLGGAKYIIGDHWSPEEPAAPKTPQEEATAKYREEIFAKYNFRMQSYPVADWGGMTDECVNSIMNADVANGVRPSADIYELDYRFVSRPMSNGLFFDLATLDELDFDEDKWHDRVRKLMTKGDSIYGMRALSAEPRGGVIWNKRLLEDAGYDKNYLYDLQASGDWTWSKYKELAGKLTRDLDGDGATDIYGVTGQNTQILTNLVASTGTDFFTQDENGMVSNNMGHPDVIKAFNFAVEVFNAGYEMPTPQDAAWNWFMDAFRSGKAVMIHAEEYTLQPSSDYGTMEDELGFVMPPKPDGAADYHSYISDNIAIIPSCFSAEEAGNIAFAYNVYTMATPGYDDPDAWMDQHYNYFDEARGVEESLPYFQNEENAHFLLQTIIPEDIAPDILWCYPGFDGGTPADKIASVKDKWDGICAEVNAQ
ncbi:MAG: extracellular solute-binding protein [Lachnospiraceae bacterium]|nr:extracellular solute-binding protein [Lachnospiraceae bacterium]